MRSFFLGCLLLIPPAAMEKNGPGGPDPVLVTKAEQGDVLSQKKVGDYYFARRDNPNGLKWLQKSAKGGYAEAQNNLGFRYENGKGVTENSPISSVQFSLE